MSEIVASSWTEEDVEILSGIMLADDVTMENRETNNSDHSDRSLPMLEEHNVVLKIQSSPTKATKIWKEYVRFVFGKKRLSDANINAIKSLQDSYYRCKVLSDGDASTDNNGGDLFPSVTFWVSLETVKNKNKEDQWTVDVDLVRYVRVNDKDFIQVVPASDECLRDEVKNNGGRSTLDRKVKRKKEPNQPATATAAAAVPQMQPSAIVRTNNSTKTFHLSGLEQLKERAMEVSENWINESADLAEKVFKKFLIDKLNADLAQYESLLNENQLNGTPQTDAYDKHRQAIHEHFLVDIVNRLGNGMVEWYDEDYMHRRLKPSLSLRDNRTTCGADEEVSTSVYDTDSQLEAASTWTYSEQDDATSVTYSTSGESNNFSIQGSKPGVRFDLQAWKQGSSNTLVQPSIPTKRAFTPNTARNEGTLDQSSQCLGVSKALTKRENARTDFREGETAQKPSAKNSRAVAYCALGSALGSAIRTKGNYSSALTWFQKALDRQEAVFGKGHPLTAKSYYDIGTILHEQGNFEGARDKYRKALAIWKSAIGKEKDTATVYYNIGNVLAAYESIEGK